MSTASITIAGTTCRTPQAFGRVITRIWNQGMHTKGPSYAQQRVAAALRKAGVSAATAAEIARKRKNLHIELTELGEKS